MASVPPPHDSTLSSVPAGPPQISSIDVAQFQANGIQGLPGLGSTELTELLKHMPSSFLKQLADGTLPDDVVQILTNRGGFSDAGPSSHPHGPPDIQHFVHTMPPPPNGMPTLPPAMSSAPADGGDDGDYVDKPDDAEGSTRKTGGGKGRRGGALMGSDEWVQQRKNSHKEVERRRRGNINEAIEELGRIVPNSSNETAKGAILARAVQYIHHLKENEARNIEKWTLEKLLMDQAMGDLQVQLDEIRKMWEEERMQRQRAEKGLATLRGTSAAANGAEKRSNSDAGGGGDKRQKTS
ncbi:hypothetical protein C8R45DRAFT_386916 [Mycena sanguinolenta]|nr:hypothetical protein C8R45DRAFT_386916 [Mycena sanguinolenta]